MARKLKNAQEYLNSQELQNVEKLIKFLNISKSEVGRKLNREPATAVYWFKVKRFDRLKARKFITEEKDKLIKEKDKILEMFKTVDSI